MFERFTDRARYVLVLAQEEARLLNHSFIGTEHLLLGLARYTDGIPAQVLAERGLVLEALREQVEDAIGVSGTAPGGSPPFTPRAKKVLELSLREALDLGHDYIGPEHIFLGLVAEGEGVAAQMLIRSVPDLDELCHAVEERAGAKPRQPGTRRRSGPIGRLAGRASVSVGGSVRSVIPMPPAQLVACSFCGRRPPESGKLVQGHRAFICEHCIREWGERIASNDPEVPSPEATLYEPTGPREEPESDS